MNTSNLNVGCANQTTCAVCGKAANDLTTRLSHRGNTIDLCGPTCLEKFAQEPDFYVARLGDDGTCVVCGDNVDQRLGGARINHHGNTVSICGTDCLHAFEATPDTYMAQLASEPREGSATDGSVLSRGVHDSEA